MSPSHAPRVGEVPSADIAVPEHERELAFYSRVLGTGASPLWREDLLNNQGTPVIGLGEQSPEYAHLPIQWMPHIQVADVAASVERALTLGGRELMHHIDEHGQSQWAVLFDPNGVAFGIIPVVAPPAEPTASADSSSDVGGPAGRISWLELTVADAAATAEFYQEVVGWSAQDVEREDVDGRYNDFVLHTSDGTAVAGVSHARGTNKDLPAVWIICLPVGDLVESLERVEEAGGEVVLQGASHGGEPHAVVRDPVGVCFGLAQG